MGVIDGIRKTNSSALTQASYYFRGASHITTISASSVNVFNVSVPDGYDYSTTSILYVRMPAAEKTYTQPYDLLFKINNTTYNVQSLSLGRWTNVRTHYYNDIGKYKFTDPHVIIPVYYFEGKFRIVGNPLISSGTSSDGTAYYSIYADGLIEIFGIATKWNADGFMHPVHFKNFNVITMTTFGGNGTSTTNIGAESDLKQTYFWQGGGAPTKIHFKIVGY